MSADPPRATGPEVSEVVDLSGRLDRANAHMLDGDCGLWEELMSHREDVSLLGAYDGHVRGWEEVSARFDRTASGYEDRAPRTGSPMTDTIEGRLLRAGGRRGARRGSRRSKVVAA